MWCLNVNLVIGFGPNLGLALWPGAKPIKNKLSSKNILKSSGSWWVPHPIHERVNKRRGRGGESILFPGFLILKDTLLISNLSLLLSQEPFKKFLWKIHSLYGEDPQLICGVLM